MTLPTGEYSEFGANLGVGNYDFCGQRLTMPTEFKAQNGLEIHQETPVTITGCEPAITVLSTRPRATPPRSSSALPAAGKLTASGRGISTGTGKATKAGDISLKVTVTKAEAATLSKGKRHNLKTKIQLSSLPRPGAS